VLTVFGGETPATGDFAAIARQADGKIVVAGGAAAGEGYVRRFLADGSPDPAFTSIQTDGNVTCIALLPDNRILAGGFFFTTATGTHNLVMLMPDGSVDLGFSGDVDPAGLVLDVAAQGDGRVCVNGRFTTVNGQARASIARLLPNGGLDPDFEPRLAAPNGADALALQSDGCILVGTTQLTGGTTNRSGITRLLLDGSIDASFDAPASATGGAVALAIQPWNGQILAGGRYFDGHTSDLLLIRLNSNGTLDTSFISAIAGPESFIQSIAVQFDGKVLVAGGLDATQPNPMRLDNGRIPSTIVFQGPAYRVAENHSPAKIAVAGTAMLRNCGRDRSYSGAAVPNHFATIVRPLVRFFSGRESTYAVSPSRLSTIIPMKVTKVCRSCFIVCAARGLVPEITQC
jgi:uncharacterized delta-60 repeat protein